jgi:beta-mannosidase
MATTKAQFGFGWDFSPRLLSAGIWDDIRLVRARAAYIEDLRVHPEPANAGDPCPVTWRLRLRVARWQPGEVRAEVSIRPENFDGGGAELARRTVRLCPNDAPLCTDDYDLTLEMASAHRWWPWDQGEPRLYRVTVRLFDRRGALDEISEVTGIRRVERGELPGGAPWQFSTNARPTFLRGANWVPADVLPGRVASADYDRLLCQAREAGINFLRVWGGGVREKRAFWDGCDRLGILAWQEFPLACAFLDHYPRDVAYLETLEAEARGTVRLLRNHPSLMAWCGGNEINPQREAAPLARLAQVLREEDPARPWIPASPSAGDVHDWNVWHAFADWAALADATPPFLSEFGMQALPAPQTLAEMFPSGAPVSPDDPRWAGRMAQTRKLVFYAGPALTAEATQRAQAAALQTAIEACRLRRAPLEPGPEDGVAPRCGGVAFWQLNEPWPAVSWAVVDSAGRPKAAYGMLQSTYQPLLIAARFPRRAYAAGETLALEFWVVNDAPRRWDGCRAEAVLDGKVVWSAEAIGVRAGAAQRIGRAEARLDAPPQALALALACGETALADNCYDLAAPRPAGPQPQRAARIHRLGQRLIGSR